MKEKAATFSFNNSKCLKKDTYMIILNDKKDNSFFKQILKKYENMINNPYMECPYCHSSKLIKWGSYTRNVCFIDNNVLICKTIKIQRVKCLGCNHTHALLPSFIIPYKRSLLDVILNNLLDTDITISINYDVRVKWNKQFNKQLPYLKTMFKNINKNLIIEIFLQNINHYYKLFFKLFYKILMMTRYGFIGMASF